MAASGSTSTVPEGFHFETKYALLCYLSLPPRSQSRLVGGASGQTAHDTFTDVDKTSRIKEQIEEELKLLEEEIAASFQRTGFDQHTSPVFSPANPESSIEDSLAMLGDRVAQDLGTYLTTATVSLSGQIDYEEFRGAVEEVSFHSQGGWSKVLVPLVLIQMLLAKGQPLSSLLALGERYLHEAEADFIIKQGGWSAVFSLDYVDDPSLLLAEDSNDIYILSGEQSCEQQSLPESLSVADSSGTGSWQAKSLPISLSGHESWTQVGPMEPEDTKSVDSGEGAVSAEERSENNSSNSDIVHVEREEAELLEEGGEAVEVEELQASVLSMLGNESDLQALSEELRDVAAPAKPPASEAPESLVSLEEPLVILEAPASLVAASPPVNVEPKPLSSSPSVTAPAVNTNLESFAAPALPVAAYPPVSERKHLLAQTEPVLAPVEPQFSTLVKTPKESEPKPEVQPEPAHAAPVHEVPFRAHIVEAIPTQETLLRLSAAAPVLEVEASLSYQDPVLLSHAAAQVQEMPPEEPRLVQTAFVSVQEPSRATPAHVEPEGEPSSSSELPILLYGGAVLAVIAALVVYGTLAYRKK